MDAWIQGTAFLQSFALHTPGVHRYGRKLRLVIVAFWQPGVVCIGATAVIGGHDNSIIMNRPYQFDFIRCDVLCFDVSP
jgi:hypothetical protein